MEFNYLGEPNFELLQITMNQGERFKIERGSMVYMQNIQLDAKLNGGGLLKAIGRSLTSNESIFITHAIAKTPNARLAIGPKTPGKILQLTVCNGQQYCINDGAFLACEESVEYSMKRQSLGRAFFGGTGGFFIMQTSGNGSIFVSSYGDLIPITVTRGNPISIDNTNVVCWDSSLDYEIQVASGIMGFKSGEGLVNTFHGEGVVYIQTRNVEGLAELLIPYMPQPSSN